MPSPNRLARYAIAAVALAAALAASAPATAGQTYAVTITNLTYDQIISPPVVASHAADFHLFAAGQPASAELSMLAEDGMTAALVDLLTASSDVWGVAVADDGIPPGASMTVEIEVAGGFRNISLAGMLVSTNDAFVGVNGVAVPNGNDALSLHAVAWDAGSEANTEACSDIPGPPCGNPGVRVTAGAEGFVHVHRGIQQTGDLGGGKDWRNPVAHVVIARTAMDEGPGDPGSN